jgi:membrane-bound lytic murein transglycosylase D
MKRYGILLLAFLWLLPACGGKKQVVSKPEKITPVQAEEEVALNLEDEKEEPLVGNVSSQRLEGLYSQGTVPGLDETLDQEMKKWELQKTFDMPIQVNQEVRRYIYYFSTDRKAIFTRYLSRSTRYLPMIKKVFAEYGLPEDLAYLAMIESGFTNKARSHANAVGMWQFIRGTAVRYRLTVDNTVDERRDPEKATDAAARYLLDLYKQFGSWYLAAASYNCGEGRVQKEINRNTDLKSFWELSNNYCLPNETKNYVPQMIAATIIAKNPEKYGFKNVPYQQPLKYEVVKMTESTSLQAAAVAATTNYDEISALNPELLRDSTPGGTYLLKIPPGKKEAFDKNILMARAQFPAWGGRALASSREDSSDVAEYYSPPRRSSRPYREYASSYNSRSANTRSTARYRDDGDSKPKAKTELSSRAAKDYDDLPKVTTKYRPSRDDEASSKYTAKTEKQNSKIDKHIAKSDRGKSHKEVQVASQASRSLKESPRASSKEVARQSEKMDSPVAASMLGFGSSKKAKKESPSIARKPTSNSSNSKSKKKKNDG